MSQQWEYCRLHFNVGPPARGNTYRYGCYALFYGIAGGERIQLANVDKPLNFNPFSRALALLGIAEWELVTLQHGTVSDGGLGKYIVNVDDCVAYFKRPHIPGRALNQPQLPTWT